MRLLFIYKIPSAVIRDPLGLLHIISVARQRGHNCRLLIYNLENSFFKKAIEFDPDVVCYSVTTGTQNEYLKINSALKEKKSFFSVFGGPHPTFYPDFIKEKGVDSICRGESEESFIELLDKIEGKKDIYSTANFWFKKQNQIVKNELRPLVENLDILPFPDRELINVYFDYKRYGRMDLITGRGCPFNCTYCFNHKLKEYYSGKGRYVRKRSVDNVILEIKNAREKYNIKEIYFVDDLFIVDKEWLAEFAQKYKKEIDIPYKCHLRADLVTEKIVKYLKRSNCYSAGFAIESGNFQLRKEILNRNMSNEQIYHTSELLKKHGIQFSTGNMLGLPYETIDNAFETLMLNAKCRPKYELVSILQPYPNTELHNSSIKNKILKDNYSIESNYHFSSPFKSKYNRQFENLHNLFALCVGLTFFVPIIKRIIILPKNRLFKFMHDAYKFYGFVRIGDIQINYSFLRHVLRLTCVKVVRSLTRAS